MSTPTEPTSARRWWGLFCLAGGLSMIVLDGTIVGVAMPTIISDLHITLQDAQWVNAIYSVVFAALLLSFGRLGDLLGRKRLYVLGIAIFVLGSIQAAFATTGSALILSRVTQGIGGAMVLPSSLSTVNATFRGRERATAFGIWGAIMAGMAALGPLLGGWLITIGTWQWIFWVNLPIGALVIIGTVLAVTETKDDLDDQSFLRVFDWVGLALSSLGFGALVFAIIEGPTLGWFTPAEAVTIGSWTWPKAASLSLPFIAGCIGLVAIAAFVGWQYRRLNRGKSVLIDLNLFTIPTFAWGNVAAMAIAVGEFALVFVLPFYFIGVLGLSTLAAGGILAAMAAGAFVSGALARYLAAWLGSPKVVIVGLILEILAICGLIVVITPWIALIPITLCLVIYGLGLGLASAQLTSTVLVDIPVSQSGQGSATQSTVRQVGSALGIAAGGTALSAGLQSQIPSRLAQVADLTQSVQDRLAEMTISSSGGAISAIEDGALGQWLTPEAVTASVQALRTGFTDATVWPLMVCVGCLAVGLLAAWRVSVPRGEPPTTLYVSPNREETGALAR